MPKWLSDLLLWGGAAIAVVFAALALWMPGAAPETAVPAEGGAAPAAGMGAVAAMWYWIIAAVGVVLAGGGLYGRAKK